MNKVLNYSKFFIVSSIFLIITGLGVILYFGLNLSIEYTGGTKVILNQQNQNIDLAELSSFLSSQGFKVSKAENEGQSIVITLNESDSKKSSILKNELETNFKGIQVSSIETVGSSYGNEFMRNSILALFLSLLGIFIWVSYTFWGLREQVSSFHLGISALISLLHDVLIVISTFSILGYFYNIEIDGLFLTALLTIVGFSINDTIVVFDRIREKLNTNPSLSLEDASNESIFETLNRSITTSFVVMVIMLSLFLLGGESIRYFSLALVIGIIAGTYSSIFIATPFLIMLNKSNFLNKKNT